MPDLKVEDFERIPFTVQAVQITSANLDAVAKWCQGDVRQSAKPDHDIQSEQEGGSGLVPEKYIKVRVSRPANDKQTMAYVTDWVLYAGTGYKVYTDRAFRKSFKKLPQQNAARADIEPDFRSAESGQFVTEEYAAEHPDTTVRETE